MKTVACYIRVSPKGKNQAAQRREINRWLKENRINPNIVRWYIDRPDSDSSNGTALESLQASISDREVGAVVVWRLDRLSAKMRDGLRILSDLSKRPIRFVSVTQDIDFRGGVAKQIALVVDGIIKMAYETKREQARVGLAAARARGRLGGRPELSADDARVVRVKKLHQQGKLSVSEICKKSKISRSTYYRYIDM